MRYYVSYTPFGYVILDDKRNEVSPTFETEIEAREYLNFHYKQ